MSHFKMVANATEYTNYYNSEEYDAPNVSWITGNNVIHYDGSRCYLKILPFTNNTPRRILKKGSGTLTQADVNSLTHTNNDGVIIGEGVGYIGSQAFKNYSGLKEVTLPSTLRNCGNDAFYGCNNLERVNVPKLDLCFKITYYSLWSNPLYLAHHLFLNGEEIHEITVPDDITSIQRSAFIGFVGLKKLNLNNVVSIGYQAFSSCSGLTNIEIPDSVVNIEGSAFSGCTNLKRLVIGNSLRNIVYINYPSFSDCNLEEITVSNSNQFLDSRDNCNAIIETPSNKLLLGSSNTIIPNTVIAIEASSFKGCKGLTSIVIPNNVTYIGPNAFAGCSNLESVSLPNSITSIPNSLFSECGSLTNITIPNSVTTIGLWSFYKSGLTGEVVIPSSVTSIGAFAFTECQNITSVKILASTPPTLVAGSWEQPSTAFVGTYPIYVPAESVNTYKTASVWSSYASRIQAIPS